MGLANRILIAALAASAQPASTLAAGCAVDRSAWPRDEIVDTAVKRLCAAAGGRAVTLVRATVGAEAYRIGKRNAAYTVEAETARGALWGAWQLADAFEQGREPRLGLSRPRFPVREWWSSAFQANFNLPLGGAFDRPIEEISGIVRRIIAEAPRYGVNTLQLMGRAGEGGIDVSWFLEYGAFPKLRSRRIGYGIEWRVEEIRALAREAHRHGLDFLLWDHEIVFPPGMVDAYPEIRGTGYPVCFSHPLVFRFLDAKFDEFFARVPEVDGVTLTFAETRGYNILEHGGCQCGQCRRTSAAEKVRWTALAVRDACRRHGKRMEVRSYNQTPRDAAVMQEALRGLPSDVRVITKNTVVDFRGVNYPDNPMLGAFRPQPEAIELTACPEGSGYGFIPALLSDFYARQFARVDRLGAAGAAIRVDYHLQYGHATFFNPGPPVMTFDTPNGFNVHAASRLAWDSSLDLETLWDEWAGRRYGRDGARAIQALRATAAISEGIFFVKGFSLLTHLNQVAHLETIDQELEKSYLTEFFPNDPRYRAVSAALRDPSEVTLAEVLAEKDKAIELARRALADASGFAEVERGLRVSLNAAIVWRGVAETYFRLRRRPFDRGRFESAVAALERDAARIEAEQGRSWPIYPAARGVTVREFIRQARERAKGIS